MASSRNAKWKVAIPLTVALSTPGTSAEELDSMSAESKVILEKLDAVRVDIVNQLKTRDERIEHLETEIETLKRDAQELKNRLDDGESCQRSDSLIISGDALPPAARDEDSVGVIEEVFRNKLKYCYWSI